MVGTSGRVLCVACYRAEQEVIWRRRAIEERLERSGLLTGEWAHMCFESYICDADYQHLARTTVEEWLGGYPHHDGASVLLWSRGYGTGKSHLAVSAYRKVIEVGGGCVFWMMGDLLSVIRCSYSPNAQESELALLQRAVSTSLLILDDLGKEYVREESLPWFQGIMFQIIDGRYRAGRGMLLTSNLDPQAMGALLGGAAVSRLLQMVGSRSVDMTGPDWRLR